MCREAHTSRRRNVRRRGQGLRTGVVTSQIITETWNEITEG